MKLNKLLIPAYFFLLLFTIQPVSFAQSGGKVWIVLEEPLPPGVKIFRHSFDKEGLFWADTSNDYICANYSSSLDYMVETGIGPVTLPNYITRESLQTYNKIICERISGFNPIIRPTSPLLANQITRDIPDLKGKPLSYLAEMNSSILCKDPNKILNDNFVKVSNTNLAYYCVKDSDGVHKVNLCEAGQSNCKDIKAIKDQACNLDVSENKGCDYLKCFQKEEKGAVRYQEAFTNSSGVTTKERVLFCMPSDNYTESIKVVCSSKITTPSGTESVSYDMASNSIGSSTSTYKDVCKIQSNYLAEGPSRTLKESISEDLNSNSCSLAVTFDDETRKTDKVNCDNPTQCIAENFYSRGSDKNIFCISGPTDSTKGIKYTCKKDYKHTTSWGGVTCVVTPRTQIQSYNDFQTAMSLTGNFCGEEHPCKRSDADFNEFTESVTVGRKVSRILPLGYTLILRNVSQVLYATAVFLFVLLMIINGIHLVRSGDNPEELKKAKEGIFRTIAGFLFVLFSGGFIISIINSMQQINP